MVQNTSNPDLAPRDAALLSALLRANFDLSTVAHNHGLSIPELLAWLNQPRIQALTTDLHAQAQKFLEIRHAQARLAVLSILEKIAHTSEDPIEQRRAAAAVLRHIPIAASPISPLPTPLPRPNPPQLRPSPSTRPSPRPTSTPSPSHRLTASPSHPSPTHPLTRSPSPLRPTRVRPPFPPTTPVSTASLLFHAFVHRDIPAIKAHFTRDIIPGATLDGRPLLDTLPHHRLNQMPGAREVGLYERFRSASVAVYTFTFDLAPYDRASFSIRFVRTPAGPWLIDRIHTLDSG